MNGSKYKFPIGIQTFSEIREGGYLYVDKTGYVHRLAHHFKFVFLSRPRRFGKSLLLSTMRSYFEGRRDLFEGLEAGRLETEWVQYPVLHISLASVKGGTLENLNEMGGLQLRLLEDKYGIERTENGLGARLQALITGCAKKYGKKVVVLVDEYDAPLLSLMHKPEQLDEMRLALRAFYSPLKDCDEWLRFVFITGISKFSQLSIFSELNNLKRITMVPEYSAICGITEQELHEQWGDAVTEMAADIGITTEEAYRQLKECYDGYHFAEDLTDVYNPFSLLNALVDRRIKDHWFETGTPTVLVNMLQKFNTDITRLEGSMATSEEFDAPTERMKSVLPLFYQSGYLTIKGYDRDTDTYTLGYPNNEVYQGMMRALAPYYVWDDTLATTNSIVEMYRDLRAGDWEAVAASAPARAEARDLRFRADFEALSASPVMRRLRLREWAARNVLPRTGRIEWALAECAAGKDPDLYRDIWTEAAASAPLPPDQASRLPPGVLAEFPALASGTDSPAPPAPDNPSSLSLPYLGERLYLDGIAATPDPDRPGSNLLSLDWRFAAPPVPAGLRMSVRLRDADRRIVYRKSRTFEKAFPDFYKGNPFPGARFTATIPLPRATVWTRTLEIRLYDGKTRIPQDDLQETLSLSYPALLPPPEP